MESILQDLRYGIRTLLKQPGFTIVAVITLALGIGANTAIFSVVNSVLLRPLPFPQPDRLVKVAMTNARLGEDDGVLCVADFMDWQAQNKVFEDLAAFSDSWFSMTGGGEPVRVRGVWATTGFFSTLKAQPMLGRTFIAGDDVENGPWLVILSHHLWQQRFNSDPQVVNKTITLNGKPRTILGVMPPSFTFPPENDRSLPGEVALWVMHPLARTQHRGPYYLTAIARLKSGATLEQARSELTSISLSIKQANPLTNADNILAARSLKESMVGDVQRLLFVLLGGVAFVLLIASVNVANLSLSRAARRGPEMAIRRAVGAGQGRIIRQLLTESLLLAGVGAIVGVLLAWWGMDLLLAIGSANLPRIDEVKIDRTVLVFTTVISVFSGLLFGLFPAFQASRVKVNDSLKEARAGGEGRGWRRTRNVLVVTEVALSIVLLAGAGLMLNSFLRLRRVSPGFAPQNILTTELNLPGARYEEPNQINGFYEQLIERVSNLPGVEAAGIGMSLPPNLLSISDTFTIEGVPVISGVSEPSVPLLGVSSGYFTALGVPLLAGRNFADTDRQDAPPVVIINDTFARHYFPNQNPIGRRIKIGGPERPRNPWMQVIGVVGDVKYGGLETVSEPAFYQPYQQIGWSSNYLVLRARSDPRQLAGAVRNAVWSIDKDLPVANLKTMEELLSESVARPRFRTFAFLLLGLLALVLSVTGIYAVMSYLVTQRTREFGIRVALGAQQSSVLRLVIRQGMGLALIGVTIGLLAAWALMRLMTNLLFGVKATDPLTFASITILLLAVALVACWVPARRATKVDPLKALRYE